INKIIAAMQNKKFLILLATALCSFLTPIAISSVNIALPAIIEEFNINSVTAGWIVTAYLFANGVFLAPFGKLGDLRGKFKIFKFGVLLYLLSSLFIIMCFSIMPLLIFRVIQGLSAAMMWSVSIAILAAAYPINERGKVLGINIAAVYLGLSLGPFFGGVITYNFSWRYIFVFISIISFALFIVTFFLIKKIEESPSSAKIDTIGISTYIASITALLLGLTTITQKNGILLIITGAILLIIFIIWEYNFFNPMIDIKIFSNNRVFIFSNLAALINYSSTFAVAFLMSLYLQYVKGLNPQKSGILLIFQPFAQFIITPYAGRLSDKIKPAYLASFGMLLTVFGLILLTFTRQSTPLLFFIIALILLGVGFVFFPRLILMLL
ncbi:MAG TPA: MFS transporter, partial [bacterium]|nr:MFS transporter [bacterium]